jgi:hypothetical protein
MKDCIKALSVESLGLGKNILFSQCFDLYVHVVDINDVITEMMIWKIVGMVKQMTLSNIKLRLIPH